MACLFEMRGLRKSYAATRALAWADDTTVTVEPGTILGLAGENGAGKSTLLGSLTGSVKLDSGELRLAGASYDPTGPFDALSKGVALIPQETQLLHTLTVAENLLLGREREYSTMGFINTRRRDRLAREALAEFDIDPRAACGSLPIEHMKMVELARALATRPRILLLDETSNVLSQGGAQILFSRLKRFAARGGAVIFATYRLDEIIRYCSGVTILKDGAVVTTQPTAQTDETHIAAAMVGRAVAGEIRKQHFQSVVASLEEGVVVLADDRHIESANPAALRILGISDPDGICDRATGATTFPLYDSDGRAIDHNQGPVCVTRSTHAPQTGYVLSIDRPSDGQRIWLSINTRLLQPDDPQDSAVLISFTDITAQRRANQRLAHEAAHDALTGLPNRAQLLARIDEHLRTHHLHGGLSAVLFIDLDNFKTINDSLGHHTGDEVLQAAAQRLTSALRSSDVVGRFGGDEFVALIAGIDTRAEIDEVAERIHAVLDEPALIGKAPLVIRASVGFVIIDHDDRRDVAQILRDADSAMYQAKTSGGRTSRYFIDAPLR